MWKLSDIIVKILTTEFKENEIIPCGATE